MHNPIDIGTRRELFVDDLLIESMQDVRLELHRPERREIAFACKAPWEDNIAFGNSVLQDGNTIRLYYRASIPNRNDEDHQAIALAESTDGGITFTRPHLGLVEFQGSRRNNILMIGPPPHIPPAFIDTNPACPPDQRYKGLSSKWQALYAMCSADGLRWRPLREEPLVMEGTFDTINTAFWDSLAGCYRSFTRYFENLQPDSAEQDLLGPKPTVVRAIQSSTSQNFVQWTPVVHHQYDDAYDDMQLYTNATLPCPGAEHIYLAFPNRYVQQRVKQPSHPYPGANDALFMSSRDCIHWKRYPEAWVRPGLDERNWTERNNYPVWGIVQTSPVEWSMYITEHYRQPDVLPRFRRLSIRPHGLVSLHANFQGGEVVTKPIVFGGRRLRLNYSTSAAGSIQVELRNAQGEPIPGYALKDMEPLFGDALDEPIAWKSGGDLSNWTGKPVQFRFVLRDADIFALRVAPESGAPAPAGKIK